MNNNKKILLEKYIKKAIKQKLQEEEAAIKRAEKSLYLVYRFPKLKEAMENILSPSFSRYLSSVTVVAPKPTTFNVELINGLDFQLIYSSGGKTEGNFIASSDQRDGICIQQLFIHFKTSTKSIYYIANIFVL